MNINKRITRGIKCEGKIRGRGREDEEEEISGA
jgi:hypothetical protein